MMKYTILILGLVALCSMTPAERTVELEHSSGASSTAINMGGGIFMGAGHCADHGVTLSVGGQPLEIKDYSYDHDSGDWAIFYSEAFINDPEIKIAPIIKGETCWFWYANRKYPVVFYETSNIRHYPYYGQPPIQGVSGSGIFNSDDRLVAIVVASPGPGGMYDFKPTGIATPVLGLVERDNPVTTPPATQP